MLINAEQVWTGSPSRQAASEWLIGNWATRIAAPRSLSSDREQVQGFRGSVCRKLQRFALFPGAPWDSLFGNTQKVVVPNSTREVGTGPMKRG